MVVEVGVGGANILLILLLFFTKKQPQYLVSNVLRSFFGGAAGSRTLVQRKHLRAFYMLSPAFVFSSAGEVEGHTRTDTLAPVSRCKTGTQSCHKV